MESMAMVSGGWVGDHVCVLPLKRPHSLRILFLYVSLCVPSTVLERISRGTTDACIATPLASLHFVTCVRTGLVWGTNQHQCVRTRDFLCVYA
jgi:hypothetical protein